MDSLTMLLVFFSIFVYWAYWKLTKDFNFFEKRRIPGPKPVLIFGNLWGVWNKPLHIQSLEYLKKYGKIYGTFRGSTPCLNICDPELLKRVLIKDFSYFSDRPPVDKKNKFASKVIAFLDGHEWKSVREVFTSSMTARKLKTGMQQLNLSANRLVTHLQKLKKVNLRWEAGSYIADITGSCLCGTEINAIGKDDPIVVNAFKLNVPWSLPATLGFLYPKIGLMLAPRALLEPFYFFERLANHLIAERRKKFKPDDTQLDYLGLFIEAAHKKKGTEHILADEEMLTAQVSSLFSSAFDATAHTISSFVNLLSVHKDYQNRLRNEIITSFKINGGFTYDSISEMPFLDACFKETLRLYPAFYMTDRECQKDYHGPNGVFIRKGDLISIPIYAIHHDEDNYENPESFYPERFMTEGKKIKESITYMPFTHGPRNCPGMLFGILSTKILVANLFKEFEFFPTDETENPIPFTSGTFGGLHRDQIWVGLKKL